MSSSKQFNKVLLVEGNDDRHVVYALRDRYGIAKSFEVKDCKGSDPLFDVVPVQLKESDITTVGIIVDADVNLEGRWQRLRQLLIDAFPGIPHEIGEDGLIVSNDEGLKVGVWIMPDNHTDGMLEDFLRFLVPDGDNIIDLVDELIHEIERRGIQPYRDVHKSKARIHTWLALQEDPGTPLGQSVTKRYLDIDNAQSKRFESWMKNLFDS